MLFLASYPASRPLGRGSHAMPLRLGRAERLAISKSCVDSVLRQVMHCLSEREFTTWALDRFDRAIFRLTYRPKHAVGSRLDR